jgi:hypothetical protein
MVHAFVRQSGGALRVESKPGIGSSFRILLPATSAPISETDDGWVDGDLLRASVVSRDPALSRRLSSTSVPAG